MTNNTVYSRQSEMRTFFKWCARVGIVETSPAQYLYDSDSPLRSYKRTYGKVQSLHPGRWLTHEQAYTTLVGSCDTTTMTGLRDAIVLRLGLSGMRISEIRTLTLANVRHLPTITWTGKGRKPRKITAGTALCEAISTLISHYPTHKASDPLVCPCNRTVTPDGGRQIAWHTPFKRNSLYRRIVHLATAAGLGHVAPHDLRRSAAGLLHSATDEHGAHHFDLLDIQRVLGHSDPATTMRSYLEPNDTTVLDRASSVLD